VTSIIHVSKFAYFTSKLDKIVSNAAFYEKEPLGTMVDATQDLSNEYT
jgi:hypothetical protein